MTRALVTPAEGRQCHLPVLLLSPHPGVTGVLGQRLCEHIDVVPRAADGHVAVGAACVGSAVPAGAEHAPGRGQVRIPCGWGSGLGSGDSPRGSGQGGTGRAPVIVRRTWVMALSTSASLSVSMCSDSFPAIKPHRTCPCLGREGGAESCCASPCPPAARTPQIPGHLLLWRLQHHESDELLEPVGLQVSVRLLQGRLVLPHHFQELLLGLPERLLELQEDLVVGAKAQVANGLCFPLGKGGLEEFLVAFLEETCSHKFGQATGQLSAGLLNGV